MPKVDILIATRNDDAAGLRRTLESVQRSDFQDARVLLVNDSQDALPDDVMAPGRIPVEVLSVGKNIGLTKALLLAAAMSEAEFLARADVGDELSPLRLGLQTAYLDNNPQCVLVGCASELFVISGHKIEPIGTSFSSRDPDEVRRQLYWTNPLVHGSIMIRSSAYRDAGGYDQDVRVAQDIDLYLRLMRLGKIVILQEVLHKHSFNLSSSITIKNNRVSTYNSLRSRIRYLTLSEMVGKNFTLGLVRDVTLLSIPGSFLKKFRLMLVKRRRNALA